jgi:hypothetical protein
MVYAAATGKTGHAIIETLTKGHSEPASSRSSR